MQSNVIIGPAPDFKLMRGMEILSHRAIVEVIQNGEVTERLVISNYSLFMVCKEIRILAQTRFPNSHAIVDLSLSFEVKVTYLSQDQTSKLAGVFRFPAELTPGQTNKIIGDIDRFF